MTDYLVTNLPGGGLPDGAATSAAQAAAYLHVSYPSIKKAVYEAKTLQGQKLGGDLCFTRAELDRYKAEAPKPGRKVKAV